MIKSDRLEVTDDIFTPEYWQCNPNDQIEIGKYKGELTIDEMTLSQEFKIVQVFSRISSLQIYTDINYSHNRNLVSTSYHDKKYKIKLDGYSPQIDAFAVQSKTDLLGSSIQLSLTTAREPEHIYNDNYVNNEDDPKLLYSIFHLFNFTSAHSAKNFFSLTTKNRSKVMSRIVCNDELWNVEIIELKNTEDISKKINDKGGVAITHIGKVRKCDGQQFSVNELMQVEHILRVLFSFSMCKWVSPQLWASFNADDIKIHMSIGTGYQNSYKPLDGNHIFDERNGDMLEELFPLFSKAFKDPIKKDMIWKIVYWHILGAETNVDARLILTQAALELFSSVYCLEIAKMISEKAFAIGKLSASDKFRLLLSGLDVPFDFKFFNIDNCFGKDVADAVDYIVKARNDVTHGSRASNNKINTYEASQIMQWFVEVSLLKLLGYKGKYSNRLKKRWVGQVEFLPNRS